MAHKALMMIRTTILDSIPPVWPVGLYPGPRAPSPEAVSRAGILDIEGESKVLTLVLRPVQSSTISAVGAFLITEAIPFALHVIQRTFPTPSSKPSLQLPQRMVEDIHDVSEQIPSCDPE